VAPVIISGKQSAAEPKREGKRKKERKEKEKDPN
jgi:hypothetical protein